MRHAIEVLRRRKWAFLIPFLIVFILPVVYVMVFMRTYEANSMVWLNADVNIVPTLNQGAAPTSSDKPIQAQADTLQQLVQSRAFLTKMIASTSLQSKMGTERQRSSTIDFVRRNTQTDVVGPNALRITFYGKTPAQAVDVVDSETTTFLEWVRQAVKDQNDKSIKFFSDRSAQYSGELSKARASVQAFKEQHPEAEQLDIADKVLTAPKITASPAVQATFAGLKEQQTYAETLYKNSLEDLAKVRVLASAQEEQYLTGLKVIDRPIQPTSFSMKRFMLAVFLAFIAAVAVGGSAVVIAEFMDPTLRSSSDVEEVLSLPVLAEIRQRTSSGGE